MYLMIGSILLLGILIDLGKDTEINYTFLLMGKIEYYHINSHCTYCTIFNNRSLEG